MIESLLGHTRNGTTRRHARLIYAPLRAEMNAVGGVLKPRISSVGHSEANSVRPDGA
jgi:hypothetical protein